MFQKLINRAKISKSKLTLPVSLGCVDVEEPCSGAGEACLVDVEAVQGPLVGVDPNFSSLVALSPPPSYNR